MRPSLALFRRSAWKGQCYYTLFTPSGLDHSNHAGPYFVAFPSLATALRDNTPIYTKARSCTILPNHIGVMFFVHNGKDYLPVRVTEDMVGHKLGEFSPTRQKFSYRYVGNLSNHAG